MFEVYRSLDAAAGRIATSVVSIGAFDGVHRGHQAILRRCVELARERDAQAVALTFDPHPAVVVAPERAPKLLMTCEQRLERLAALGLDAAVVTPFTREFSRLTAEEFVRGPLVERLGACAVVVGDNFRFGRQGAGDVAGLRKFGERYGFAVEAVEPVRMGGEVVSSTRIRHAVEAGRVAPARRLLGEFFALRGDVVAGRGIGSRQTVPTLNIAPWSELLPADGVYTTRARDLDRNRAWRAVSNVGVRPTFGGGPRTVETHLLEPLIGDPPAKLEIEFRRRLRDEREFDSPEALKAQILADIARSERYFDLLQRFDAVAVDAR